MDEEILKQIDERLIRIEKMLIEQKTTLDMDEAVEYTKIKKSYLYRLTSESKIPHYKRGNKLYFDRTELDSWMKQHPVKTEDEIDSEAATYCSTHK
jgi:excisionase family DNA binding protein